MWNWDQGRMQYFQYDALRTVSKFIVNNDLRNSDPEFIRSETGLSFSAPKTHTPWRNYSRIFKLCLIASEFNGRAIPTDVASVLSQSGLVTCDEYLHFLVEASTTPSPALSGWKEMVEDNIKHPLCFALKYILAKAAGHNDNITPINEIVAAFQFSGFNGGECDADFLQLLRKKQQYESMSLSGDIRQARESIKFISQISYLHYVNGNMIVSLERDDAHEIFNDLNPISGPREEDGNSEIQRLAKLFRYGTEHDFFDYKSSSLADVLESGFDEGSKVKKTHVVIERNSKLRSFFFEKNPSAICDSCDLDTSIKYPWVKRVLDIHHILPLSSGTRVDSSRGTLLDDLAPVCPSCHRAIHRYYDQYLKAENKKDFNDEIEAKDIYSQIKKIIISGNTHA